MSRRKAKKFEEEKEVFVEGRVPVKKDDEYLENITQSLVLAFAAAAVIKVCYFFYNLYFVAAAAS
jgi:hypothetical protein